MKKLTACSVACLLVFSLSCAFVAATLEKTAMADEPAKADVKLAHMVFFALKDKSPAARDKLVKACHTWLSDHPGTEYFSVGTLSDLNREVNDRDYDVALHVIFKNRAAHDQYQTAAKHLKFIEENKDNWAKVRVFDSDLK